MKKQRKTNEETRVASERTAPAAHRRNMNRFFHPSRRLTDAADACHTEAKKSKSRKPAPLSDNDAAPLIAQRNGSADMFPDNIQRESPLLKEMLRHDIPESDELHNLVKKAKHGDLAARNRVILFCIKSLVRTINRIKPCGLSRGEAVNVGSLAICRAIEKYDPTRGTHFVSYATWWVRQFILDENAKATSFINIPIALQGKIAKLLNNEEAFRGLSDSEIAEKLNIKTKELIHPAANAMKSILSLDRPSAAEDGKPCTFGDLLTKESAECPYDPIAAREIQALVKAAVDQLPERQRFILYRRFGFEGEPETLVKVGKRLHISRERVRQIQQEAYRLLRRAFASRFLRDGVGAPPLAG